MTILIHGEGVGNVHLTLSCDTCPARETFTQDNYVLQRSAATKAGWLERVGSTRLFLCPACVYKSGTAQIIPENITGTHPRAQDVDQPDLFGVNIQPCRAAKAP